MIIHNPDLQPLIQLVHHRWNIPVIAELHKYSGSKYTTLANHLGLSRAALSSSLEYLIEQGLVRRNTGHGHPMRPEYLLTDGGQSIGADCFALTRLVQGQGETDLAYRKWSLPLVAAIGTQSLRFKELRSALAGATPRAITLGLKSLLKQNWAIRNLIDDFPPSAGYELGPRGLHIHSLVGGLMTSGRPLRT